MLHVTFNFYNRLLWIASNENLTGFLLLSNPGWTHLWQSQQKISYLPVGAPLPPLMLFCDYCNRLAIPSSPVTVSQFLYKLPLWVHYVVFGSILAFPFLLFTFIRAWRRAFVRSARRLCDLWLLMGWPFNVSSACYIMQSPVILIHIPCTTR